MTAGCALPMLPAGAPKEEPTDEMVDEQTAPDEDAATEDQ